MNETGEAGERRTRGLSDGRPVPYTGAMPVHPGRILFSDDSFLAVQKLPRELVVKGSGSVGKLPLLDYLKKNEPGLRPANRLDFETSGIVLFARTKQALEAAIQQQKDGKWLKVYRTLVAGQPKDSGEIRFPLPARTGKGEASAHTTFRVLKRFDGFAYVEAIIATGRHHQIRRHMAAIGHPLILDNLYGDEKYNRAIGRAIRHHHFFLHAFRLSFPHPFTGRNVTIEAPLPPSFQQVLDSLR